MSSTQTALVIATHLGPFELAQVPIYTPGQGQLLIKVHAAALNPGDWKVQKTGVFITEYPSVIGLDRAGEVVEVGEGVEDFKKGDRVLTPSGCIENRFQAFQQYALAKAYLTTKLPSNISYDQAATIPIGLGSAFSGLFAEFPNGAGFTAPFTPAGRNSGAGKVLLIIGGSSSVGQYAIQSANIADFSTIIATASLKNESLLISQGATHVLDRSLDAQPLITAISGITSKPIDSVFDAIGLPETERLGIAVLSHSQSKSGGQGVFISCHPKISDFAKEATHIRTANLFGARSAMESEVAQYDVPRQVERVVGERRHQA